MHNKQKYQLLVFLKDENKELFFHKCQSDYEVLVQENYFAFFVNEKLFFYQEIKASLSKEQITQFLNSNFNAKNIDFVKEIKKDKKQFKKYNFIKYKNSMIFKIFLLYCLFLLIVCAFLFSLNIKEEKNFSMKDLKNTIEKQKNSYTFEFLSHEILKLYYYAKQGDIQITYLEFAQRQKHCTINLQGKNKKEIYKFLKKYDALIKNFKYNELTKRYEAHADIKLFRK